MGNEIDNSIHLNWGKYSWRKFEKICFHYIKTVYSAPFYKVNLTRGKKDGGRDIVIRSKTEEFEAWGECKNHKRNLDLSVIGKNVVLALSHKINKAIFFSVTPITYNTKVEILNLSQLHNFDVLFLDGDKLNREIIQCKNVAIKYFKKEYDKHILLENKPIYIETILSEFQYAEGTVFNEKKQYHLSNGFEIYLYILIKNMQNISIQFSKIDLQNLSNTDYIFYNTSEETNNPISPYCEKLYKFSGLILSSRKSIKLPEIKCVFVNSDGTTQTETISSGLVDASDIWRTSYINSGSADFLASVYHQLREVVPEGFSRVIYLSGQSGTGKSRLITEIENKANELPYKIIHIDFRDRQDIDSIRYLFIRWFDLPYAKDGIHFKYQEFYDAVFDCIQNNEYIKALYEFLYLSQDKIRPKIFEEVFFSHFPDESVLVTFDNIQEINSDIQILLWHITSACESKLFPVCLVYGLNTEKCSNDNNLLVSYLRSSIGREKTENYILQYNCAPLLEKDAISILMELLHLEEKSEKFVKLIIQKIGTLPLDLVFFAKTISAEKNIFSQIDGNYYITNPDILMNIINDFTHNSKLDAGRISNYINSHFQIYHPIFMIIILFEGKLPVSFFTECGFDNSTLNKLCKNLILKYDKRQDSICFYNDQIHFYLKEELLLIDKVYYEKIIQFYNNEINNKKSPSVTLSKAYLKSLIALGEYDEAKSFGENILEKCIKANYNKDVCDVCTELCDIYLPESDPVKYSTILLKKADFLLERVNIAQTEKIYEEIKYIVDTRSSFFDDETLIHFYHRYINQKLHTGQYNNAINALKEFERIAFESEKAYYIIHDRYCVAYFYLGDWKKSIEHIDKVIQRAYEKNDSLWLSIAYSDKAFAYYYNCVSITDTISAFAKAVHYYEHTSNIDISREIEIKIQKSLYLILEGNLLKAELSIQDAVDTAEKADYSYLLVHAYNILSYILSRKSKYQSATDVMKQALGLATVYSNQKALISIYNNLWVILALNGELDNSSYLYLSKQILEMHAEWDKSNQYKALKYNLDKYERGIKTIDNNIPLECKGYYFLY